MMGKSWRNNSLRRFEINENRHRLRAWYQTGIGSLLSDMEQAQVNHVLATLFGYHAIQVGCLPGSNLLAESRIGHRVVMDPDPTEGIRAQVYAYPDSLPVRSDSVDLVVLPHTLEFERAPHEILREVERVLIPEGHVIILSFNPMSLWGVWRLLWQHTGKPPWSGRFLGLTRCKDWLALLGFDVVLIRQFFFRPPLKHQALMNRLLFLERLGQRFWHKNAGVYMIVAKKRVTALTPIRPRWRPRRSLVGSLAGPSPRNYHVR